MNTNATKLIQAARIATDELGFSVRVEQGRGQLVQVGYKPSGESVVTPLGEWMDGDALLAHIAAWPRHL